MKLPKLPNAVSSWGASMGRNNHIDYEDKNMPIKFHLVYMPLSGDYDTGGAYWGYVHGDYMYRAIGEGSEFTQEMFFRAKNRNEAKEKVLKQYPKARFYQWISNIFIIRNIKPLY